MSLASRLVISLQKRLTRLSIFWRIAIGNSLIIIVGAVCGTLLTRHLASRAADWWLILFFAAVGLAVSLLVNFIILGAALRPLRDLRQLAERLQSGGGEAVLNLKNPDPDTLQLAATLHSLVTQLEARNRELRALSERAINTQEEERREIARSLHDDTGQALSMLIISLDRLEEKTPVEYKKKVRETRDLAANALAELRRILFGLRPAILDDLGLVPAIRWYARANLEQAGIQVEVHAAEDGLCLSHALTTSLFRIAQEAINNILRHSQAGSVQIRLSVDAEVVCLRVEDDGRGFDVSQITAQALQLNHLGLLGIQERAGLLRGEVSLESAPGKGTRLEVHIPLSGTISHDG